MSFWIHIVVIGGGTGLLAALLGFRVDQWQFWALILWCVVAIDIIHRVAPR